MDISDDHRKQLAAILDDLRCSDVPIDLPRIERALVALLEAVIEGDKGGER